MNLFYGQALHHLLDDERGTALQAEDIVPG